jgi:hypothetical protein
MLGAMTGPASTSGGRSAAGALAPANALALLAASAAALTSPGVALAGPAGRVVRIERAQLGVVPRLGVMGISRGQSMCLGQPRAGERVALIDIEDKAVHGELVIDSVGEENELAALGLCVSSGAHSVKGTITPPIGEGRSLVGLRGARLNRRVARVLTGISPPSGRTGESVELAVDADGNGRPDLIVTQYACDATGTPSASGEGRCIDTYMDQHGAMRRVLQESVGTCR